MTIKNENELREAMRRLSRFFSKTNQEPVEAGAVFDLCDALVTYCSCSDVIIPADVLIEIEPDARRAALVMFACGVQNTATRLALKQVFAEEPRG